MRRQYSTHLGSLAVLALLLLLSAAGVPAASAFPPTSAAPAGPIAQSFAPGNGTNGIVYTLAVLGDGKILLGGDFTNVNGMDRNYIARLNSDGTLDPSFNPGTNNTIYTLAEQGDGKILIGGRFSEVNGTARTSIARLNSDGTLDPSFNPGTGVDGPVFTMAEQGDGKILLAGDFNSVNGTPRNYIARLNADGSLDTSFNPGTNGTVYTLAVLGNGKILLGGDFTEINGTTRTYIAQLNANGSLDTGFNPGVVTNGAVFTMAVQSDGKILLGGVFVTRLNANGTVDTSFNPGLVVDNVVRTLAEQSDGKILIGGAFTYVNGTFRSSIARLNADGSLDMSFDPGDGGSGAVNTLVVQSNGKVLAGGEFTTMNRTPQFRIAQLNANGALDLNFNPPTGANYTVRTIAVQADRKVLIGGEFTQVSGAARSGIARLNADGTLDPGFNPGTGTNHFVWTIAEQSDGKVLIGGQFTQVNGTPRNFIARLNADGTLDPSFNPGTDATVYTLVVLGDGKILIGGQFNNVSGTPRNFIARLNADGSLDPSFNPGAGANDIVYTLAVQSNGKIVIGGDFTQVNGTDRNSIARLNADGSLDTSFDPGTGANNSVYTLALQGDGKILIGGQFAGVNGTLRPSIARLNANGSLDTGFDPGMGVNGPVITLAVQGDGKVLIGGRFNQVNGTPRNFIARLNANGSLDPSFDPGTNNTVQTLVVQGDGNVLIAGEFTSVNNVAHSRIARLNTSGGIDLTVTYRILLPLITR